MTELSLLKDLGLGAGVLYSILKNNDLVKKINEFQKKIDNAIPTAQVVVKKIGEEAWAIDNETKQVITHSKDHASVIQKAVDYLSNGGRIYIKVGTYYVNHKIVIDKHSIIIQGDGVEGLTLYAGTVLRMVDGAEDDMFEITGRKVTFRDIVLYGNKGTVSGEHRLIYAHAGGPTDFHAYNVYVMHSSVGIQIDGNHSIIVGTIPEDNKYGIVINGNNTMLIGVLSYSDDEVGIQINGNNNILSSSYIYAPHVAVKVVGNKNIVVGNMINTSAWDGIIINGSYNNVSINTLYNIGFSVGDRVAIRLIDSTYNSIKSNIIYSDYSVKPVDGIREEGKSDYNVIEGNIIVGIQNKGVVKIGTNTIVRHNVGYPTEASGVVTLSAGSTRVTVSHGLVSAPSKVLVTPYGNARVWVENITDTSFDIVTDAAPSSDIQVAWYAEV